MRYETNQRESDFLNVACLSDSKIALKIYS